MDREWLLMQLRKRMSLLEKRIDAANNFIDYDTGKELSRATASFNKSKWQKEYDLCYLVEFILLRSNVEYLDNEIMERGFDRLVNPVERHYNNGGSYIGTHSKDRTHGYGKRD